MRWLLSILLLLVGCAEQDFEVVDEVLRVSDQAGVTRAGIEERMSHDVVTRHSLDYQVRNPTGALVELVVFAESFVNGVSRADGRAVLRLDPGEEVSGRISDLELELGNELDIELQCCVASRCVASQVLCPSSDAESENNPWLCFNGCTDIARCAQECPSEASCEESCPDQEESCVESYCYSGTQPSNTCDALCEDDETCLAECAPSSRCLEECWTEASTCAATCLSLQRRCLDDNEEPTLEAGVELPCQLCPDAEETGGMCTLVLDPSGDLFELTHPERGTTTCAVDCSSYPPACTEGCLRESPDDGLSCMQQCLVAFQERCDLEKNAINPSISVPCCYRKACAGELEAVAKFSAVECFENADCGSERKCNERGLCENKVAEEQTGCTVLGVRGAGGMGGAWLVLLGLGGVLLSLRRKRRRRGGRFRGLWGLLLVGALLVPMEAEAGTPSFRRTRSSFSVSLTTAGFLGGALGAAAGQGLGLAAQETLQSGYFGLSVRIGAALLPSVKEGTLPFDEGLSLYYVGVGPRLVIPTFDEQALYLFVQPEYLYMGFQSNALVLSTGEVSNQHGVGAQVGASWYMGSVLLEPQVSFDWIWPAGSVSMVAGLSVGFAGVL